MIQQQQQEHLINHLKCRYEQGIIHNQIGEWMIILKPKDNIIYSDYQLLQYQKRKRYQILPHHIYMFTIDTLNDLIQYKQNQNIVISGESGSGKTQNLYLILHCLLYKTHKQIHQHIIHTNTILECFGNAQTDMNINSSRFGRLVTLLIDQYSQKIIYSYDTCIFFEKSRITNMNQSIFSIFYTLLNNYEEKWRLGLLNVQNYMYLNKQQNTKYPSMSQLKLAFTELNFTQLEQDMIFQIIATILLLGNLDFDESSLTNEIPCKIEPIETANKIAELLLIRSIIQALLFKTRSIGGIQTHSPLNRADCIRQRDCMAQELYESLFSWINTKINSQIVPDNFLKYKIFDFTGFEILSNNSLEQLCINLANEKIRQIEILNLIKNTKIINDYWNKIDDNYAIINLIEGQNGIFQLMEDSQLKAGTDITLATKIRSLLKIDTYDKTKSTFTINHSNSIVEYNSIGFRLKNKDEVAKSISDTLYGSPIMAKIFKNQKQGTTISSRFKQKINEIIIELSDGKLKVVKCINPQEKFEENVQNQINYLGVLQYIRLYKQSFSLEIEYKIFYRLYGLLESSSFKQFQNITDHKTFVIKMNVWKSIQEDLYLFGKNMISLKCEAKNQLNYIWETVMETKNFNAGIIQQAWLRSINKKKYLSPIIKIQKWWRSILKTKVRKYIRIQAIILQKYIKRRFCMNEFNSKVKAIFLIQKQWKNKLITMKKKLLKQQIKFKQIIFIQSKVRRYIQRGRFLQIKKAAQIIQSSMRTYWIRNLYLSIIKSATIIQKAVRKKIIREKQINLRQKNIMNIKQWQQEEQKRLKINAQGIIIIIKYILILLLLLLNINNIYFNQLDRFTLQKYAFEYSSEKLKFSAQFNQIFTSDHIYDEELLVGNLVLSPQQELKKQKVQQKRKLLAPTKLKLQFNGELQNKDFKHINQNEKDLMERKLRCLQSIKIKVNKLIQQPKEKWSFQDIQFMCNVENGSIKQKFENIK